MDILEKLIKAEVAACTCMTKTPVWNHHSSDCRYRILHEAYDEIVGLRANDLGTRIKEVSDYQIAILEDRYGGAYNGGYKWVAVKRYQDHVDSVDLGPMGDDLSAMAFWENPHRDWIACGDTPDQALSALKKRS